MIHNFWRDTGNQIKFWIFDWRLSITLLILIFNLSELWAYMLVLTLLVFFQLLNRQGYTLINFIRFIHSKMIGRRAHGKPYWAKRKYF